MKFITSKDISLKSWNDFILVNPYSSPFQTHAFCNFYNSINQNSCQVFAVENGDQQLDALAVVTLQKERGIKSYFSHRGIIYGGPLFKSDKVEALIKLMEGVESYLKKDTIYLEIRNLFNFNDQKPLFSELGWKYIPYCNYFLNISTNSLDNLLSKMDYNRRREIKLSLKEGAIFGECQHEQEVKEIYHILAELYHSRVKLPLPSFKFFQEFYRSGIGKVFYVKHNGKIIGGSVCPVLPGRAIYTMYYCGLRNYHKKIYPTHLAVLAAIYYAINNSIPVLDFMGAGKMGEEYGVRKYKKEFGGQLVEYGRFLKITKPMLYHIGKAGLKITSKVRK